LKINVIDYSKLPDNKILCVDIRSFFASVEAIERGLDPLKVCLAVVGDKSRSGSVVLAASPVLKQKYDIKTGNRLFEISPASDILIVEARMGLYLKRSLEITLLFHEFLPLEAIHVYSVDESWLKLDGLKTFSKNIFPNGKTNKRQLALLIKKELLKRFGLPCSMGLGPNMFLAKVAMDIEGKKIGLADWAYEDVSKKLWPLKLEECWGIGYRLAKNFRRIGINTIGELAQLPLKYLEKKFGIMGSQLYYHARGVDLSRVEGHYNDRHKSMGRGITLFRDYTNPGEIKTVIFELAEEAARRARTRGMSGQTIYLGVGYSRSEKEKGFHKQQTINHYTNLTSDIYRTAESLFDQNYKGQKVRRISVALGKLSSVQGFQLDLFSDKVFETRLNQVKDLVEKRFGHNALFPGRSLCEGSIRKRIKTTIGGHGV